jgi:hypothetical protein
MSTPTNAAVVAASYPLPPLVQRYAKLIWGAITVAIGVLTTVINNNANVMSPGWLAVVQAIIGGLGLAALALQGNAPDPSAVVNLVDTVLPNHILVPKAAASLTAPQPIPALPTPVLATPTLASDAPVAPAPEAVPAPPALAGEPSTLF